MGHQPLPADVWGDLPSNDAFTLSLLINKDVLSVLMLSRDNRQLFRHDDQGAWIARDNDSNDHYLALFNIGDEAQSIKVDLAALGSSTSYQGRDLWTGADVGVIQGMINQTVAPHASRFYGCVPTIKSAADVFC